MIKPGEVVHKRRTAMNLSLNQLTAIMGGSPAPSFISRVENDLSEPGYDTTVRIADALRLPTDTLLNAFGLATREQRAGALSWFETNLVSEGPRAARVPVMMVPADLTATDPHLPTRVAYLTTDEQVFIVDVDDPPFRGEALVSRDRDPAEGRGVIIEHEGRLRAGTYHTAGRRRHWVSLNGDELERTPLGVIIRYTVAD